MELEVALMTELEKLGSLGFDEVMIKPGEEYLKNYDVLVGGVDMAGIVPVPEGRVATRTLAYVFRGLGTNVSFPVAYFFVDKMTAEELLTLTLHVIEKVEATGLKIVRLEADNHATNTKMFRLLHPQQSDMV